MESFVREAASVDVASSLRELREARGISMRTRATKSGLSANALSMIERGNHSVFWRRNRKETGCLFEIR